MAGHCRIVANCWGFSMFAFQKKTGPNLSIQARKDWLRGLATDVTWRVGGRRRELRSPLPRPGGLVGGRSHPASVTGAILAATLLRLRAHLLPEWNTRPDDRPRFERTNERGSDRLAARRTPQTVRRLSPPDPGISVPPARLREGLPLTAIASWREAIWRPLDIPPSARPSASARSLR